MKFDLVKIILLGALQGVTEFIPVSSSGHLLILRNFLGLGDIPKIFDILMHIPTLLVVLLVFRKIIIRLVLSLMKAVHLVLKRKEIDSITKTDLKLILIVIITSILTVTIALVIDPFDEFFEVYPRYTGILFIITGIILIVTRFFTGKKDYDTVSIKTGFIAGIAQGLGVLPGISRSGITIAAALFTGIKQEKAGEFSFLIGIPAILGAFLLKLTDAGGLKVNPLDLGIGLVVSFFIGLLSLLLLIRIVQKGKFYLFSFYLIPAGIAILLFL
ncbi:MAG: undecaprenyl-diphosphate phosphatase [Spirochaetales bacterium]|nr:undecaprenyl-diphosphate phosphatase [Spirochaetales bacterium]